MVNAVIGLGIARPQAAPDTLSARTEAGLYQQPHVSAAAFAGQLPPGDLAALCADWAGLTGRRSVGLVLHGPAPQPANGAAPVRVFPARDADQTGLAAQLAAAGLDSVVLDRGERTDLEAALLALGNDALPVFDMPEVLDEVFAARLDEVGRERILRACDEVREQRGGKTVFLSFNAAGSCLADELAQRAGDRLEACRADFWQHLDPDDPASINIIHLYALRYDIGAVVLCAYPGQYREIVRMLVWTQQTGADVILPFHLESRCEAQRFEDPTPVLINSFAYAGSGRITPGMQQFAAKLKRRYIPYKEPSVTAATLRDRWREEAPLPQAAKNEYLRNMASTLDFFEITYVHHIYDLRVLDALPGLKVLVILRDPRDILTSMTFFYWKEDFLENCSRLMDGRLCDCLPYSMFHCPPLRDWITSLAHVLKRENMGFIRFEDVHHHPRETFLQTLRWLGWQPDPFATITDADLDYAIHLGSFRHQTGGKRQRGAAATTRFAGSTCRKGVPGDWKNHWDEALKDKFKRLAGPELIALGYEKDLNW